MKVLYYLHGWNSGITLPLNPKLLEIQKFCDENGYEARFHNIDYQFVHLAVDFFINDIANPNVTEAVLVGTSLGGWLARMIQLKCEHLYGPDKEIYAVAFNPSVRPGESLRSLVGKHTNYASGEVVRWTLGDFDQLDYLASSVNILTPMPFYVFVEKGDELIDWRDSRDEYRYISYFHLWEGGQHRFDHLTESLEIFKSLKGHFHFA